MKQFLMLAAVIILLAQCKKEDSKNTTNPPAQTPLSANSIVKKSQSQMQDLVRAWTEWTYGRSVAVSPVTDPTGDRQAAGQPYPSETFLLAGASDGTLNPPLVKREISLDLSKYQNVFVPLINLSVWYNECDPTFQPAPNQQPAAFFAPFMSDAFDQHDNHLQLILDNTPVLTASNQAEFRASSGVWNFKLDPSQDNECTAQSTTISTDGYWALIKLTPGKHTIEFGGSLEMESYGDYKASDHVMYTIYAK